jgi:EamA domain-containing membrane protein RarD
MIKKRDVVMVYIFTIITFGIYGIYWKVKTKDELNSLGADIPTAWLLIIPIANIYWLYKYAEGYSEKVKKDNNSVLWFIVFWFIGIIIPAFVQTDLNNIAENKQI